MNTRLLPIYAAAIMAGTISAATAQDDLDSIAKAAATPAPTVATTPKPAAIQAPTTPQPRAATATAPRPTPAPAKPQEEAKPDLSRAKFVGEGDLAELAGQRLSNVYLTGTYKSTGSKTGGRYEFTTRNVILGSVIRGSTKVLVHFPKAPNAQLLAAGNSSQWAKASPLHLERVEKTDGGITAYATDTP